MKFANPPYCKFHTPQGHKICKKKFNKLREKVLKLILYIQKNLINYLAKKGFKIYLNNLFSKD